MRGPLTRGPLKIPVRPPPSPGRRPSPRRCSASSHWAAASRSPQRRRGATCLIRPHLLYALFTVSRITMICCIVRQFCRKHVLTRSSVRQEVVLDGSPCVALASALARSSSEAAPMGAARRAMAAIPRPTAGGPRTMASSIVYSFVLDSEESFWSGWNSPAWCSGGRRPLIAGCYYYYYYYYYYLCY